MMSCDVPNYFMIGRLGSYGLTLPSYPPSIYTAQKNARLDNELSPTGLKSTYTF